MTPAEIEDDDYDLIEALEKAAADRKTNKECN